MLTYPYRVVIKLGDFIKHFKKEERKRMVPDRSISGRIVYKVAHITKEGRHILREKYGELGFKFKNVGDNAHIIYEDVEASNMHLLEEVEFEMFRYIRNPK